MNCEPEPSAYRFYDTAVVYCAERGRVYGEPEGMRKIYQDIILRKTSQTFEWLQEHLDLTELYSVSRDESELHDVYCISREVFCV